MLIHALVLMWRYLWKEQGSFTYPDRESLEVRLEGADRPSLSLMSLNEIINLIAVEQSDVLKAMIMCNKSKSSRSRSDQDQPGRTGRS